jgi:cytochrome c oxidase cbb3-type subunit IV
MNINDLRSLVTVLSFVLFLGILAWAISKRNKARFEAAARLPLLED